MALNIYPSGTSDNRRSGLAQFTSVPGLPIRTPGALFTLATIPTTPSAPTATVENAQSTVSWSAPATGGTPIIGYFVQVYLSGSSSGSPISVGLVTTYLVTGLTNGSSYTFTVQATNVVGSSAYSTASSAVVPVTVPGTPAQPSAVAGNALVTVSWSTPGSDGGSAITGYDIQPYVSGSPSGSPTSVGVVTSTNVTGLTNGTAYTFAVRAKNAVGSGSYSSASASATPSAPVAGTVSWGSGNGGQSGSVGLSFSNNYPPGLVTGVSLMVLVIGQKPATANGGGMSTPSGWTAVSGGTTSGAGGYGSTLGSNTGNVNVFSFYKVAAGETGALVIAPSDNNVAWSFIARIESTASNGIYTPAATIGSRTTGGSSVNISGASDIGIAANDLVLTAFVIPTTVATFSAETITATGVTWGTLTEYYEPSVSTVGNHVGGVVCYRQATAGASSAAPAFTATVAGTNTDVRGPVIFIRIRGS